MVRITAGLVGSLSIWRRLRIILRSTARSNASASRALASSSSRSRDSTRLGLAANTFSRPNSEAVSGCSLPSSSRSAWASRSSHLVPNRTSCSFSAFAAASGGADVEADDAVDRACGLRQHDDGNVDAALEVADDRQPVFLGHVEVEHHEI